MSTGKSPLTSEQITSLIPKPEPDHWVLFSQWVKATATNDPVRAEGLEKLLKLVNFYPYTNGYGYPTLRHWYPGRIEAGMRFVWDPEGTAEEIKVVRVGKKEESGADENWIYTSNGLRLTNYTVGNEESRFREMVVPIR